MGATPTCSRCHKPLVPHCRGTTGKHPTCSWHKCVACELTLDLAERRGFDNKTGHPLNDIGASSTPEGPKKPPRPEGP